MSHWHVFITMIVVAALAGDVNAQDGVPPLQGPHGSVIQRGGAQPIEGLIDLGADGVRVRSDDGLGVEQVVPWDRVRDIECNDDAVLLLYERYRETAEDLWRARIRVERNDLALAEPLLLDLFETYRGQTNETAAVVAEGLLRCLIARAAIAEAVVPALETARLRAAGMTAPGYSVLVPVIDEESGLCPRVPPAWVPGPTLARVERDLAAYIEQLGNGAVREVALQYRLAMRRTLGSKPDAEFDAEIAAIERSSVGADLLGVMNEASGPGADVRSAARARIEQRLADGAASWTSGWLHFTLGESLLRERDPESRQRGMVQLLHVPAEASRTLPYLAGLSLLRCARAAEHDGLTNVAVIATRELEIHYAGHPALTYRSSDQ